jgi:hypothetical protein
MYQDTPKRLDRAGPRAPAPTPAPRIDAALDVICVAPKRDR